MPCVDGVTPTLHFGGSCAGAVWHCTPPASPHPRHLFAIANVAYSKVMDAKHNQCIVIRWDMAVPMHSPLGWPLINITLIAVLLPPAWLGPRVGCWGVWGDLRWAPPAQLLTALAVLLLCIPVGRAAQGRPKPPS